MKTALALLVLVSTISFGHAGGFGGPPPFTNGSPLVSGVDGGYQASIRGENLSGLLTFTYSGGVQSASGSNAWVVFYQGQVFFGETAVNIMDGNISGILDTAGQTPVTFVDNFSSTVPSATSTSTVSAIAPSGYFTGDLDNNSTSGYFKGKGEFSTVLTITNTTTTVEGGTTSSTVTEVAKVDIKIKGVRASTT